MFEKSIRPERRYGIKQVIRLVAVSVPAAALLAYVFAAGFIDLQNRSLALAKWINVGFWLLLAGYYLLGGVLEWSDPLGPVVLLMGIALLIPAGVNCLLYRNWAA